MRTALAVLLPLLALTGCNRPAPQQRVISLPTDLEEVSGLAMASPNSVFTHNDEHAIVHEIDILQGRTMRSFALGDPTVEGDFEGIAYAGEQIYLITSDGIIYAARPGADGERVPYIAYDTGIGPLCETEGLANAPTGAYLLVLCKRLHRNEGEQRLEIHRWALGAERAEPEPWLSIPLSQILEPQDLAEFRPSAIDLDTARGRILIVSGNNRLFLQLDLAGHLIDRRRLDPALHRQTEGLAILPGCRMLLADEGTRTRRASISVYPCPA